MKVHVLLFGILKDIYRRDRDELEIPEGFRVSDVVDRYRQEAPEQKGLFAILAFSVNQEYVAPFHELRDGDEMGMLPPVSGGVGAGQRESEPGAVSIILETIRSEEFVQRIQQGGDGAICLFEGRVRDNTKGRRTLYLNYEAYEPMALLQMRQLREQALRDFEVREVVLVHRLGRLEIGEVSVLVIVASAHRGPAFEACRWVIDTLKKTVPIWKREHFEDGTVWAPGEPFPAEITAQKLRP